MYPNIAYPRRRAQDIHSMRRQTSRQTKIKNVACQSWFYIISARFSLMVPVHFSLLTFKLLHEYHKFYFLLCWKNLFFYVYMIAHWKKSHHASTIVFIILCNISCLLWALSYVRTTLQTPCENILHRPYHGWGSKTFWIIAF